MTRITISLPDDVKDYVEAQVGRDFADTSEYLTDLIRRDQERRLADLRRTVDEALESGISTQTTEDIFAEALEIARRRGTAGG